MDAVDSYIPFPPRLIDQPFLMPVKMYSLSLVVVLLLLVVSKEV